MITFFHGDYQLELPIWKVEFKAKGNDVSVSCSFYKLMIKLSYGVKLRHRITPNSLVDWDAVIESSLQKLRAKALLSWHYHLVKNYLCFRSKYAKAVIQLLSLIAAPQRLLRWPASSHAQKSFSSFYDFDSTPTLTTKAKPAFIPVTENLFW